MNKAFIFDFDGVIVDSEIYWDRLSFESYLEIIPEFTKEYDSQLKGRNTNDIYDMLVRDFGLNMSKKGYYKHMQKITDKIYGELSNILPGIEELLGLLRAKKIPIAIASSSERSWIESTLKRLKMDGRFGPIITAADVGVGKPNPAVFLEAAKQVDAQPEYCIALEDSKNGVRAAKDAGMTCIGLHHKEGYQQDLTAADIEIWELSEITDALLERFGF
jgi:HAD superfamily hydrolase (TIGR01509 family)